MASNQFQHTTAAQPDPGWRPPKLGDLSHSRKMSNDGKMRQGSYLPYEMQEQAESSRRQLPSTGRELLPLSETSKDSFGFRKAAVSSKTQVSQPALKGKSSRNVLRRKQSTIAQPKSPTPPLPEPATWFASSHLANHRIDTGFKRNQETFKNRRDRQPIESTPSIAIPQVIPELDRYRSHLAAGRVNTPLKISTQNNPPPTPQNSVVSGYSRGSGQSRNSGHSIYSPSPSTRFSESPGPGPWSRDTTPTSMSSVSPSVVAPSLRTTARTVPASMKKGHPQLTRRVAIPLGESRTGSTDAHGVSVLRESSLTSSSSGSTVKTSATPPKVKGKAKTKSRLNDTPPSPPPRKSSQKMNKSTIELVVSPSKASKLPAPPIMSPGRDDVVGTGSTGYVTSQIGAPPARPSRENTPSLGPQFFDLPVVIQSNMSGLPISPERRRSSGTGQSTKLSASGQSVPQQLNRQATQVVTGLGIIPDLKPQSYSDFTSRSPSPASATLSRPRFGFFKRSKTTPELLPSVELLERRKGPAAGTGHEGYGRHTLRGRSNGNAVRERSYSGASSSQESIASHKAHDPFFLERLSPVILTGGGETVQTRSETLELNRIASNSSFVVRSRPSIESKSSYISSLSKESPRTTMWPTGLSTTISGNMSSSTLASKGSTSNAASVSDTSIAYRRSILRLDRENEKFSLPVSIKTSPSMSSRDTSLNTDGKSKSSGSQKTSSTKKLVKRPGSPRKWNIFKRNKEPAHTDTLSSHSILVTKPEKFVAHYAMLDSSEQENDEPIDIKDILRDADVADLSQVSGNTAEGSFSSEIHGQDQAHAFPIASPQIAPSDLPQSSIISEARKFDEQKSIAGTSRSGRPSRLPQVGRIPKVVSARPEQTSPKSFSRPFARVSMVQPASNLRVIDRESIALGPGPSSERSPSPGAKPDLKSTLEQKGIEQRAFLVMSSRKSSEAGTSSSSGRLSMSGITAVVPDPDAALEEDEVWDEYNDLIGNEAHKVPVSATSSHGVPFQYERFESKRMKRQTKPLDSPVFVTAPVFLETPKPQNGKPKQLALSSTSSTSIYSPDLSKAFKDTFGGQQSPMSQISFSDFIAGYHDRDSGIGRSKCNKRVSYNRIDGESTTLQPQSSHASSCSRDLNLDATNKTSIASRTAQVNLRVSSMTVSKWLTFGHVLFSPTREDISLSVKQPAKNHSVLVIDGLGNDDWSFYAAETYPSATFYNLSPRGPSTTPTSPITTPSNHRQVRHPDAGAKIPFPREFFSTVVIRFPSASSEAILRHLISEAKRVLKPMGYLELSILDLDMRHMGDRLRRAIRKLKTRFAESDPNISFASASDSVLKEVGKKGFSAVKSCRVGIPVSRVVEGNVSPDSENEVSLADMMRDESVQGDDSISKMVAKVGRWWWSQCYEGDFGVRSVFADEEVMQECEEWGTFFNLLVCYAQKPAVGRRRTASV